MSDLYQQITEQMHVLDDAIKSLAKNGEALAEAEKAYKVELAKVALRLKADNMAVTLINQVIYGLEPVAELRLQRDIAKANYDAKQEFINVTKLKLRLLEAQLGREWGNT